MKLSDKATKIKPSSTLALTAMAKKLQAEGVDLVSFTAGEPDFDTPDNIKAAAIEAINSGFTKYTPSSGTAELRKAIAQKYKDVGLNFEPAQIVVSNGGKHSLVNIFLAVLNDGDEVIIPSPYWLSYPEMVSIAGGVPVICETKRENDFKVTREELLAVLTDNTKAIIINSPSNPVGNVYSKEELNVIADFAIENDLLVISDEIYEHLIYDGKPSVSIASLGDDIFKRTVICSGVSKSYSMTGWRIGYTASSKEIADLMGNVQSHMTSNPNSIAQKAAFEAITSPKSQEAVDKMRTEFEKRRDYACDRIDKTPKISCNKPGGAFYLFVNVDELLNMEIDGKKINNATDLSECLVDKASVVVIPCDDFGFNNYIRLSYATSMADIEKGMDRIEKFIKTYYE